MDGSTSAMLPPADAPRPEVAPYPPRYGWTKRIARFGLVLLLVIATVWAAWRQVARRRLARELAAIAARGEPVRAADLLGGPLADEDNAAVYLRRALGAIRQGVDTPAASTLTYNAFPPYPPEWHRLADAAVEAHGEVFRLARAARARPRADWGLPLDRPLSLFDNQHMRDLNRLRHLANLLSDAALHQHVNGDDAVAVEAARDCRHLARAMDQEPVLLCHLVAVGIDSLATERILTIAPGLTVEPEGGAGGDNPASMLPATRPSPRPASRAQVRALIEELLADADASDRLYRAVLGDRALNLAMSDDIARDARLLKPMADLDVARVAALQPLLPRAATQPTLPAAQAVLAQQPAAPKVAGPRPGPPGQRHREAVDFTRVLSEGLGGGAGSRVLQVEFRVRAERRMAAVSRAVQLYRADHGGAWPPSLQALVPQYLPAAPQDPFAADGRPLGYVILKNSRPDGADRPVVYTVAEDGADQTAAGTGWSVPVPAYSWIPSVPDQWRDLSRWEPPPPTPPTQPAPVQPATTTGPSE